MASEVVVTRLWFFPRLSVPVFAISVAVIFAFIAYGAGFTAGASECFSRLHELIVKHLGWYYTLVVVSCFVASSDSGSLVIDMLSAGGDPDPPRLQRMFWTVLEGVVASIFLLLAGGLGALQTASISSGLLFLIVMLFMCDSLAEGLKSEPIDPDRDEREPKALKKSCATPTMFTWNNV
ncbi:MAG: BCCT family transporter [Wenzhouxiangellaceae bacterium]|nr:BCCT family transporter [Wenzhouxiangellaceae bacterium]